MILLNNLKTPYFFCLFFLYCLANVFFLLNFNGIYWDDWALVNQEPDTIKAMYSQTGFWWMGYLHIFLQKIGNGVYVYRLITFFSYFFTGVLLFFILDKLNYFTKNTIFFIALLFLLSPVNDARVALINTPAILTLLIFYFAFFLLSIFLESKKKFSNRLIILSLFFITFSLESLLVFYAIVLFYILIKLHQKNPETKIIQLMKLFFIQYLDFICLPLLFFVLKHSLLKPHDLYAGYNDINFNLFNLLHLLSQSFTKSLYEPILQSFKTSLKYWFLTAIILVFVAGTARRIIISFPEAFKAKVNFTRGAWMMLLIGILVFLLAVFPYCAVGKLPQLDNWASRNQILVPLGMSLIIYYIISLSKSLHQKLPVALMIIVVSTFIVQTLYCHYLYNIDWFYQKSLLAQFKQSKIIRDNTTFIALDHLEMEIWTHRRGVDFYEMNGLLKKAFHEDNRLVVHDISLIDAYKKYKKYPQYNFSNWVNHKPVYLELSQNAGFPLTNKLRVHLFYNSIFNTKKFNQEIQNLTTITYLDK